LTSQTFTGTFDSSTDQIKLKTAGLEHAAAIHELIEAASRVSTVLPRSLASIQKNPSDFIVALNGSAVVGCGALHRAGGGLAEIRSLVVADSMRDRGIGAGIVRALVDQARRSSVKRLFVLTDQVDFFLRAGFVPTDKETLPHKIWNDCILCPKFDHCTEVALDMRLE
jgi:amino-acid N-acetyltransferase